MRGFLAKLTRQPCEIARVASVGDAADLRIGRALRRYRRAKRLGLAAAHCYSLRAHAFEPDAGCSTRPSFVRVNIFRLGSQPAASRSGRLTARRRAKRTARSHHASATATARRRSCRQRNGGEPSAISAPLRTIASAIIFTISVVDTVGSPDQLLQRGRRLQRWNQIRVCAGRRTQRRLAGDAFTPPTPCFAKYRTKDSDLNSSPQGSEEPGGRRSVDTDVSSAVLQRVLNFWAEARRLLVDRPVAILAVLP